jgi:hypothetical protein
MIEISAEYFFLREIQYQGCSLSQIDRYERDLNGKMKPGSNQLQIECANGLKCKEQNSFGLKKDLPSF